MVGCVAVRAARTASDTTLSSAGEVAGEIGVGTPVGIGKSEVWEPGHGGATLGCAYVGLGVNEQPCRKTKQVEQTGLGQTEQVTGVGFEHSVHGRSVSG